MEITVEQSLQNIRQVLNAFKGTREEHYILDNSFEKLRELYEIKKDTIDDINSKK